MAVTIMNMTNRIIMNMKKCLRVKKKKKRENDMGVYIPNMELPPWCGKCSLQDGEICYAINENDIGSGLSLFDLEDLRDFCIKRRDDCPLIDIVTCGECKYIYTDEGATLCGVWGKYTFKDGFCYQGERRADGNKRRSV